ncbi:MAG: DMT family transporter [Fibrobacterota bacterium]
MAHISSALVALAALFWGLSGGIAALLMAEGWNATVVAFYRGAIGLLFVLIWLGLRPRRSGLTNPRVWLWAAIAGLGVGGNFTFYFISIDEGSVAVAATLMYCAPVFVYLVSFLLKLERPTPRKWVAVIFVMIGVVLLTGVYDVDADAVTAMGLGAGLLSALSYALFIFGFKSASFHGSPQAILAIAFAVLVLLLILPAHPAEITRVLMSSKVWMFIVLGLLGAGVSFIIYIVGLKHTAPAVAAITAMVEPVTASIFGVAVLKESLAGMQILGMGLILITVTALSVHSQDR